MPKIQILRNLLNKMVNSNLFMGLKIPLHGIHASFLDFRYCDFYLNTKLYSNFVEWKCNLISTIITKNSALYLIALPDDVRSNRCNTISDNTLYVHSIWWPSHEFNNLHHHLCFWDSYPFANVYWCQVKLYYSFSSYSETWYLKKQVIFLF